MNHLLKKHRDASGLTVIETMVAISIFAITTVGVVPLLASSMRGSTLSRSYTVGKNVVQQSVERVRGLPFFIQNTQATPKRVDLLDFYYPNLTAAPTLGGTGYYASTYTSGSTTYPAGSYVIVCTPASTDPACPNNPSGGSFLPAGHTMTFVSQFVGASAGSTSSPETYSVQPPTTGYNWTSTTGGDTPQTALLRMTITARWSVAGRQRSFGVTTLFGERKVGAERVVGTASVAYAVRGLTSFVDGGGRVSNLVATVGTARSDIQSRLLANAAETVSAADLRLTREGTVTSEAVTLQTLAGAGNTFRAPPDQSPANVPVPEATMLHPDIATNPPTNLSPKPVAFVANTTTEGSGPGGTMQALVANDLPTAQGGFQYEPGGTSSSAYNFWMNNQADTAITSALHLDSGLPIFSLSPTGAGSGGNSLRGSASAVTTAIANPATRKVETAASTTYKKGCLFPVTYIPSGGPCLIKIDNFSSSVRCMATGLASQPAVATGTYSVTVQYYADNLKNGQNDGSYVTVGGGPITVTSGSTTATDLLQAVKAANPLVYDASPVPSTNDVNLFPFPGRSNFLSDWRMLTSVNTQVTPDNKKALAQVNGAIQINTAPTNPAISETGLNLSIGNLNCAAQDNR